MWVKMEDRCGTTDGKVYSLVLTIQSLGYLILTHTHMLNSPKSLPTEGGICAQNWICRGTLERKLFVVDVWRLDLERRNEHP